MKFSLIMAIILASASVFGFLIGGYVSRTQISYAAVYVASLGLAAWFSTKMRGTDLAVLGISSFAIASAVEPTMTAAGLWKYLPSGRYALLYPIMSTSVLLLLTLMVTTLLYQLFKGLRKRNVYVIMLPVAFMVLTVFLMWFEGYTVLVNQPVTFVYFLLLLLSLYYVVRSPSGWNVALAFSSVIVAASMEMAGSLSGLWNYPYSSLIPLFLPVAWSLNIWAMHGLALILGVDLRKSVDRIRITSVVHLAPAVLAPSTSWPSTILRLEGSWNLASSVGLLVSLDSFPGLGTPLAMSVKMPLQITLAFTAFLGVGLLMASEQPLENELTTLLGILIQGGGTILLASLIFPSDPSPLIAGLVAIGGVSTLALIPVYTHIAEAPQGNEPTILKKPGPGAKRVLIIYFSVTDQTQKALGALTEGLNQEGCKVASVRVETMDSISFPFSSGFLIKTIYQAISGATLALKPPHFDTNKKYDMIVVGSPTWWISPARAITSIFSDPDYLTVLNDANVAVVVVCRALWKRNLHVMKQKLLDVGANFVDGLALQHQGEEPYRFLTLMLYLWRGKLAPKSFLGHTLPKYGLGESELEQARTFGVKLGRML